MNIEAKRSNITDEILNKNQDMLFQAKMLHKGPVHLLFPQEMIENIKKIKKIFIDTELEIKIFFAYKSNSKIPFAKQAKKEGIFIDVASENELSSALSAGFIGSEIECTGPKNNSFLTLAIHHQCLISVDSLEEIKSISKLTEQIGKKVEILIRLNDLESKDRNILIKRSRFGISKNDLEKAYNILKKSNWINLKGFHFHSDGYDIETKSGFLSEMIEITQRAWKDEGLSPTILNMGGSWRNPILKNSKNWSKFIEKMGEEIIKGKNTLVWGNNFYGMKKNERGRISGRENAIMKSYESNIEKDLKNLVSNDSLLGRKISSIINENMFELAIEPGFSLLDGCAMTITEIADVKKSDKDVYHIVIDANIYNLSTAKMFEIIADPVLVKPTNNKNNKKCEAFIFGNLCTEDDVIIKRKIFLDKIPEKGDLICFLNTAAYNTNFEDASPILHEKGKSFCIVKKNNKFLLIDEKKYNPYEK